MINREIKFRAWDIMRKKWTDPRKVGFTPSNGHCLMKVVMLQYTGLKDKNGVEIYEGDILRFTKKEEEVIIGEVAFMDYGDSESYYDHTHTGWLFYYFINRKRTLRDVSQKSEIIGNIYQNPELLNYDK